MARVVLVTGACGFSGRTLVARLCDAGFVVRAGDIAPPRAGAPQLDSRAVFVACDVTVPSQVAAAVAGCETVFHLGALVPYNHSRAYSREEIFAVNVEGTRTLVDAAIGAGVRYFLYASSTGAVFCGSPIDGWDEARCGRPPLAELNDAYSGSKAAAERVVLAAATATFRTLALRPNGIWGAGGEAHHIPKLLRAAQGGVAPFMALAPDALTDYCCVENLCHAFLLGLKALSGPDEAARARVSGKAFFVADGTPTGWTAHTLEFFSPLLTLLGFPAPFPSLFVPRGAGGHQRECRVGGAEFAALQPAAEAVRAKVEARVRGEAVELPPLIVITGPPRLPLPGWLLYPAAALLQGTSLLLRPLVSFEPFLTLADTRKVVRHNYYSTAGIARELGYAPVVQPAEGLLETAAYYARLGYDGRCRSAGRTPWLVAPTGIALTGLLAFSPCAVGCVLRCLAASLPAGLGGALSGALLGGVASIAAWFAGLRAVQAAQAAHGAIARRTCSLVVSGLTAPASLLGYSGPGGSDWAGAGDVCAAGQGAGAAAGAAGESACAGAAAHPLARLLALIFAAAVAAHMLQALWVGRRAWGWRYNAASWALQTLALGFPSTRLLLALGAEQRKPGASPSASAAAPFVCVAGFLALLPLAFLLHAVWVGAGAGLRM